MAEQSVPGGSDEHVFRSVVLLTRDEPRIDVKRAKHRLTGWLGITFPDGSDEATNFVAGDDADTFFMAKLFGQNIYMIKVLNRPYWDSEDIRPYEDLLQSNEQLKLVEMMKSTRGAILIDASGGVMSKRCSGW